MHSPLLSPCRVAISINSIRKYGWWGNSVLIPPIQPDVGHLQLCDNYLLIYASPSTEEDFRTYIRQLYFQGSSEAELEGLWTNYTSIPSEGSPFGTGDLNQLYPQYKRVAAFKGDFIFQSPRRFFLEEVSGKQKTWSYCKLYYFGMWSRNTSNIRK